MPSECFPFFVTGLICGCLATCLPLYFFYKTWVMYYAGLINQLSANNTIAFQNTCQALQMRVEHKLMREYTSQQDDDEEDEDEDDEFPR